MNGEFFASGKFWVSFMMDHPPDMKNIFNVWFNDDVWWAWTLKLVIYPWVLLSKLIDIVYIRHLCDPIAAAGIDLEMSYALVQFFGIWLLTPLIINLYIGLGKSIAWFDKVGE